MNKHLIRKHKAVRAFTLIEMLVVVTIIVLLLAFSTPALTRTLQASRLTSTGDTLIGALSEAQQLAFTHNAPVEVRFFAFAGEMDSSGTNTSYRAYQLFKISVASSTSKGGTYTESVEPVGNLVRIPEGVALIKDDELSPALMGKGFTDVKQSGGTGGYSGTDAIYNALRFMPDGSCRKVDSASTGLAALSYQTLPISFMTLANDSGVAITMKTLPKNFFTIQVDPYTGKSRSYRPGF